MKKKILAISCFILFIAAVGIGIFIVKDRKQMFSLEEKYYGQSGIKEITENELEKLREEKESFAVFIYQPMCVTSSDFEEVLNQFIEDQQISIYKIAFSEIKDGNLGKFIKYYPSFILFHEGEVVDYLEADKDEDVERYTSLEGFENWFKTYVSFPDHDLSNENSDGEQGGSGDHNTDTPETPNDNPGETTEQPIDLENVKREENKVNIYMFWGDGCPHCEEEFEFFESIEKEYGEYYQLYTFETWYDEENKELMNVFASSMGDSVKGVPYTIIGNQSFKGFSDTYHEDFIRAIETQHENSYDVYFDEIKK